jgi:hypothetical protein
MVLQSLRDLSGVDSFLALDSLIWWLEPGGAAGLLEALGVDAGSDPVLAFQLALRGTYGKAFKKFSQNFEPAVKGFEPRRAGAIPRRAVQAASRCDNRGGGGSQEPTGGGKGE